MVLYDSEDSPFWSYSHEEFLAARRKKMEESEEHLRKSVDQMVNVLKNVFGYNPQRPGWYP